jgi:nicotinamide-nucleotide amidase
LWKNLRGKQLGGYKFRRQHIIGSYIADFVCIPAKLILEVDGLIHQVPENIISDAERTAELNRFGFDVIRFTNEEVLNNIEGVLNTVLQKLTGEIAKYSDTKNPPLEGREVFFFSLPGVPHEMKGLVIKEVIPVILQEFKMPVIVHRTAFTFGQGESMIAESLKDFEAALPAHIKLAYLPNYGMVKLRLTSRGNTKEEVEKEITPLFEQLQVLVKDFLVANEDVGMETVIGKLLKERGKTMGTAESCTGGYIAHLITSQRGSSEYYKGSVVSYANAVKENVLHVSHQTLETAGAVSEDTVIQMVKGALGVLQTDYALATSGIMGPDGGTESKPVGTVWIAAGTKNENGELVVKTLQLHLRFDRQRNISITATNALNFLRKFILQH